MTGVALPTDLPAGCVAHECPAVASEASGAKPAVLSFDALSGHLLHRGHGAEFEMEARWVGTHLPPHSRRVLDLGCGIGSLFPTVGPERAVGVDYSVDGLVHTRARFPDVPLMCAAAERLPFADASFDAITLQHVVEHIPSITSATRDWRRALKPGGVLLILTPNASFSDPSVFDDPTHVRLYDRHSLPALLRDAGFEIVDLRTLGLPWFRRYRRIPAGWRLRRFVTRHAQALATLPTLRWKGQTLCCAARRPR